MSKKTCIIITAVVAVITAAIAVFCMMSGGSYDSQLEEQAAVIRELENDIAAKTAVLTAGSSAVVTETSGIDLKRVAHDDEVALEFIKKVTTWNNWADYTAMRAEIMEQYQVNASSNFAKAFLPDYPTNTDPAGNEYNEIDNQKLSCSYKAMKSMVCGINGAQYDYFTIVTCAGAKDGVASNFNFIVTYTVDGVGNIFNLDAYTLT